VTKSEIWQKYDVWGQKGDETFYYIKLDFKNNTLWHIYEKRFSLMVIYNANKRFCTKMGRKTTIQAMYGTYNLTLWGVCVQPFLQWKINNYYIFWVCVYSPRYPPCNAPYCHLWHALLYNIFLHYLINGTIFETRTFLNAKCMFRLYLQLLSKIFFIPRRNERNMMKSVYLSLGKTPFILARF